MSTNLLSSALENFLFNHPRVTMMLACVIYIPCMFVLFILWLLQIPMTIIYNLLTIATNEETELCRSTTADNVDIDIGSDYESHEEISLLTWNLFTFYGRFWTRLELIEPLIALLNVDIICIQEAICSQWFGLGTLNLIQQQFQKCDSFSVSLHQHLVNNFPLLFTNSFRWTRVIGEVQCLLNTYFLLPLLGEKYFEIGFKGKDWMKALMGVFFGLPATIGKCMTFTNNVKMQYKDCLLLPGYCDAMRALYVTRNNVKIWVVNTHLTAAAQNSFKGNNTKQTQMILDWMNDAVCHQVNSDLVVIAGDFNATPSSDVYALMKANGYQSCLCESLVVDSTLNSQTWTLATIDDDYGKQKVLDYVWVKNTTNNYRVVIKECRLVGHDVYKQMKHRGEKIQVYPSDHFGIFVKFSLFKSTDPDPTTSPMLVGKTHAIYDGSRDRTQ